MKTAIKSAIAGTAIVVAAGLGAPMAHAVVDNSDAAHSGTYSSSQHCSLRQVAKFAPGTKAAPEWGSHSAADAVTTPDDSNSLACS